MLYLENNYGKIEAITKLSRRYNTYRHVGPVPYLFGRLPILDFLCGKSTPHCEVQRIDVYHDGLYDGKKYDGESIGVASCPVELRYL